MKKQQIKVRITKLTDDFFNGNHPNGVSEEYVKEGYIQKEPTVGEEFWVFTISTYFHTSIVTEIIDDHTFKTFYSTYKWEKL